MWVSFSLSLIVVNIFLMKTCLRIGFYHRSNPLHKMLGFDLSRGVVIVYLVL